MPQAFPTIGLFAKHNTSGVRDTFETLLSTLVARGHTLVIEEESASLLRSSHPFAMSAAGTIGAQSDLIIVVGGDGSLLNAARAVVADQIPVLGINRGRLGFLADILPNQIEQELGSILDGHYTQEQRFLLEAKVLRQGKIVMQGIALNDVVLYSGDIARMIDFEVFVNQRFVVRQQADGMIAATPTGSTAYALSAGGPILYPTLNAIVMVPLCPHTLSNRPIMVDGDSEIKLGITENAGLSPKLSYDGQNHFDLASGDEIFIQKHAFTLPLIHPLNHEYFSVLREKLGWNADLLKD